MFFLFLNFCSFCLDRKTVLSCCTVSQLSWIRLSSLKQEKCIIQALLSTNFWVKNDLLKKAKVSFSVFFAMFSFHCVTLWRLDVISCFHVLYWIWHTQMKQRNAYRTSTGELHDMWQNMCNWLSENIHNILNRYMLYHFIFFLLSVSSISKRSAGGTSCKFWG